MAVGDVKGTPRKLGGIPDLSKLPQAGERVYRPVESGPSRDTYVPATRPPVEAPPPPEGELDPAAVKTWHRVGTSIGAGIGLLFSYGFIRKASRLIASGKPVGAFLGKIAPALGIAFGAWGLRGKIKNWNAPGNDRKWDDAIRMIGDGLQVAGGIAAFIPAVGVVAGLTTQAIGLVFNWLGDMANDQVGKRAPQPGQPPFTVSTPESRN